MSRLHICNTFFERELEKGAGRSLADWMRSHPIVLQLQFLPLLYAEPEDRILVSDLPEDPDPRLCLIEGPVPFGKIEHWGPSLAIAAWAKTHAIPYPIPNWEIVKKVNSKVFSFVESPKLPGAQLLESEQEVRGWIQKTPGRKVLKTPFGTAGGGHIHVEKEMPKNLKFPLIGESWVERIFDFSTQWKGEELLGVTLFENEPDGTYRGTFEGNVESQALEEHLEVVRPLLKKIKELGFVGHLGIDAYVYLWQGKKRLQPVVEINGRKTMSWAALQMPKKRLFYTRSANGLLPSCLTVRGKTVHFSRNVICTE